MLIGIMGTPCSGKTEIANFLIEYHGFQLLHIDPSSSPSPPMKSSVHVFPDPHSALEYVMKDFHWMNNYVLSPLTPDMELTELRKRPFFLLLTLDAPLTIRYTRYLRKYPSQEPQSLEMFVRLNDRFLFHPQHPAYFTALSADIKLLNPFESLPALHQYLKKADVVNFERCRPSWDTYFIRLCEWSARRSNWPSF
jgi:dCMP deaminase